jgi:beta-carotene 3-hydroxylase
VIIAIATVVAMEPITYALHRWVMHGFGQALHLSHHRNAARSTPSRFELNDLYPVLFATIVVILLAIGFNVSSVSGLVPICMGATFYGLLYAIVHDLVIHRRAGISLGRRSTFLRRLDHAHRTHHRTNGEPYGMLAPYALRFVSRGFRPSQRPSAS